MFRNTNLVAGVIASHVRLAIFSTGWCLLAARCGLKQCFDMALYLQRIRPQFRHVNMQRQ